jgi:transposase-like protein
MPARPWRVDETYVKVASSWAYLYRTVDSAGETTEFMLSPKRDMIAAKPFLRLGIVERRAIAACGQMCRPSGVSPHDRGVEAVR